MFLFARESQYVTAFNKIMFWMCILATGAMGAFTASFRMKAGLTDAAAWSALLLSVCMLGCAAGMCLMLFGKRVGGYAAVGFAILTVLDALLIGLATGFSSGIEEPMGLGALCLWPTLATLFGEKRYAQTQVNERLEFTLRGSTLGKVMFGLLYLLALPVVILGVIGLF